MKPTTAIKHIVALLEETESDEEREALTLALRALVHDLEVAGLPQMFVWPSWVRVYPTAPPGYWCGGSITIGGDTTELAAPWSASAGACLGPAYD